jgi:hypothetical protein
MATRNMTMDRSEEGRLRAAANQLRGQGRAKDAAKLDAKADALRAKKRGAHQEASGGEVAAAIGVALSLGVAGVFISRYKC